jgi:hypothetical protein
MTPEQGVDFYNRVHSESNVLETRALYYPLPRKIMDRLGGWFLSHGTKGSRHPILGGPDGPDRGHLDRDTAGRTPGGSIGVLGLRSLLLVQRG